VSRFYGLCQGLNLQVTAALVSMIQDFLHFHSSHRRKVSGGVDAVYYDPSMKFH